MITIRKYSIEIADEVNVQMPLGARVLSVSHGLSAYAHDREICIAALVDTEAKLVPRRFYIVAPESAVNFPTPFGRTFVGAVPPGNVWHVFAG